MSGQRPSLEAGPANALGALEAARRLADGSLRAEALMADCQAAARALNPTLNAFVSIDEPAAMEAARLADARWRAGRPLSALDGIPIALKDNIDAAGLPTSNGIAKRAPARRDAPVVRRLRAAGMVVLGKLNMHEAGLGTTTDNPHFGRTRNPLAEALTPGGSSGGAGAAVAADMVCAAIGTDTMGSVRLPAAFCGLFGIKPSRALVPNTGTCELLDAFDCVGPLVRRLEDLEPLLALMAGPSWQGQGKTLRGTPRVGMLVPFETVDLDAAVAGAWHACRQAIAARVPVAALAPGGPGPTELRLAGLVLAERRLGECLDAGWRAQASPGLRALIEYGERLEPARVAAAEATVAAAAEAGRTLFREVDLLIAPSAPMVAHPFDEPVPAGVTDFLPLANAMGAPALSMPVPAGLSGRQPEDLPVGIQLLAAPGADRALLRWTEQALRWLEA